MTLIKDDQNLCTAHYPSIVNIPANHFLQEVQELLSEQTEGCKDVQGELHNVSSGVSKAIH